MKMRFFILSLSSCLFPCPISYFITFTFFVEQLFSTFVFIIKGAVTLIWDYIMGFDAMYEGQSKSSRNGGIAL
jgi:hypothetical protein